MELDQVDTGTASIDKNQYESPTVPSQDTGFNIQFPEIVNKFWFPLLIGILLIIIAFIVNVNISLGKQEGIIGELRNSVNWCMTKIDSLKDGLVQLDMKLREQQIKIDYLEKNAEKSSK